MMALRGTPKALRAVGSAHCDASLAAVQIRHCRPGELREPSDDHRTIAARLDDLIPAGFAGPLVCEQIAQPGALDWTAQLDLTRSVLAARGVSS